MKKIYFMMLSLILAWGLLTLVGCRKDEDKYREGLIGKWDFTVYISVGKVDSAYALYYDIDTIFYQGEIVQGDKYDGLKIKYSNNYSIELHVSSRGIGLLNENSNGAFSSDNRLYLYLDYGNGSEIHEINGMKK